VITFSGCYKETVDYTSNHKELHHSTDKPKQNIQSDIFDKVKNITSDHLGIEKNLIKMESSFTKDLGADELDIIELIMTFEEEFNIVIPDEVVTKVFTVRDIVDYLKNNINQRQ